MVYYLYDGSFEGFLTAIAAALASGEEVEGIAAQAACQFSLFRREVQVVADDGAATRLMADVSRRFSKEIGLDIGYCFLSEVDGFENVIFRYIRLLLEKGELAGQNAANPLVFQVQRLRGKVAYEVHRFHGFVRFRKMSDGIFYAPIAPDHNIVQLLAPHFQARFADQCFLIHDVKRGTGIYYDRRRCDFLPRVMIPEEAMTTASGNEKHWDKDESAYQQLWKGYFQSIVIEERRAKQRQRQCLPARYWRYLVEDVGNS